MAGLSAADLLTLCRQDAKCPSFNSQSGLFLNMVLSDLCQNYDFEIAAKTFYFNFDPGLIAPMGNSLYGSGPYPLPADFLRFKDNRSAFWTLLGVVYPLIPCDLSEFDMMVQQAGINSYPYIIATDMSAGDQTQQGLTTPAAYVYAPPSGAFPVTVRYFAQMASIATPETSAVVPWFPNQGYLRRKVSSMLMGLTNDDREGAWTQQAGEELTEYLKLKDNRSNRATTVKLDPRRFGRAYGTLPNTKQVGWAACKD